MWFILAFISALFSAAAAIGEKKALQNSSAISFSLLLSIFNVIFSIPFLLFVDFSTVSIEAILVLFAKSTLGAFSFLFVMKGLKSLEISSSLPILVLTPGFTALLAFIFLKEELSLFEIFGMVILLFGTYLLQLKPDKNLIYPFQFRKQPKALIYIILALVIFSITSVVDKALLTNFKLAPFVFIPLQHVFYTLIFLVLFIVNRDRSESFKGTFYSIWKIVLIVSLFTIIYRFSHIYAIKLGSVALVLSIKRTSVFFATIIGGTYFNEQNLLRKTIATILMIIGAVTIINF